MEKMDEFEDMKQQWEVLQNKLKEQQNMDRKFLNRALRSKTNSLSRTMWCFTVAGFVIAPTCAYLLYLLGLNQNIAIYLVVALFIVSFLRLYNTLILPNPASSSRSISQMLADMARFRKVYVFVVILGLLMIMGLVVWVAIDGFGIDGSDNLTIPFVFGTTLGLLIAIFINKKLMNQVSEIREDLNALKEFEK